MKASSPRNARRIMSPTTPRTPSTLHTTAEQPFESPIQIVTSPQKKTVKDIEAILENKETICRVKDSRLDESYIMKTVKDPKNDLWTIKDNKNSVFGFAVTFTGDFVILHLICTVKRKGEGSELFTNILRYAARLHKSVFLEAISPKVAIKYAIAAEAIGWNVVTSEHIPMQFHSPRRSAPPSPISTAPSALLAKRAAAQAAMSDSDDESEDDD